MGHTTKKGKKNASTPRKINPYELRDKELKIEEGKRAKRKFFNWKRRQQQKIEKNAEVLDVSEFLWKKVLKDPRNKESVHRNKHLVVDLNQRFYFRLIVLLFLSYIIWGLTNLAI